MLFTEILKISYIQMNLMKRILVVIICFYSFCPITFASPAPNDKMTISVVKDDSSNAGYFYLYVAKKGNKTLWKYESQGPLFGWPGKIFHDDVSGMYVLESENLLVIDRHGKVRKQLNTGAIYAPRSIFLKDGNLVYNTCNIAVVPYDPKRDGAQLAAWLRESRHVVAYNVRALHSEWSAAESDVGVPISCNSRYLNTIRTVNLDECLEDGKKTPIVSIDKVDVKTGHLISSAILRITRPEALSLMRYALSNGPTPIAKVMWTATGVHVYGLDSGQDKKVYAGKIKKSATRKS